MTAARLSQLITGRSQRYVRTTVLLLTVMLSVAALVAVFAQDRYQQLQHDFQRNDRLHTIRIRSRIESGEPARLTLADHQRIRSVIGARLPAEELDVIDRLELGGGVPSPDGTSYTVFGFGGATSPRTTRGLLGVDDAPVGTGYTLGGKPGTLTLDVPVVRADLDGYTSDATTPVTLTVRPELDPARVRYLFGSSDFRPLVVDLPTFQRLATASLGGTWDDLVQRYEAGELALTPLVGAVYVRIARLDDVETAAHQLQTAGYDIDYALEAFDDLSSTLRATELLGAIVVLVVTAAAVVGLTTSWTTYFTLSRRDIGMLRHFGFDQRTIRSVYARRLTRGCALAVAAGASVATTGALALMGSGAGGWLLVDLAAMVALVAGIRAILLRGVLERHLRASPLELLKLDRQFQ
jgi:cell division protein FtsX